MADKDALLKVMFQPWKLAQYTLSRFLTKGFAWTTFGKKRIERLQQDSLPVWATNLVVLQAVLKSGLEYPLIYRIWHKPETKGEDLTKIDLATR
ncbi:hypothetical protein [Paenibacillus popilliae]|uniref:hypothetical protein n=1 Tax=Paenibacillus popilliae TaxID=78057 RepID=UPI0005AB5A78|nr:hypothetical protein [Paenibacillus popilliae]